MLCAMPLTRVATQRGADYKADDEEMQVGAGAEDEVFSSIAKPKESASAIVSVRNVHKTYLLGIGASCRAGARPARLTAPLPQRACRHCAA